MLLQFNFKNFKSFRDDTTLDLTATKISEFNNHVISISNERILPVASIFGANASGKSNVQEAFRYMSMYVINSLDYGDESDSKKKKSKFFRPTPFLFDNNSKTAESSFEVYFIDSEENGAKTYNYGFTIDSTGVREEWLNCKAKSARGNFKTIFYRHDDEYDFSGIPTKSQENLRIALEKETLIVSLGAKLKIAKLKFIRDWFINNDFADFGRPIENFFLSQLIPDGFAEDEKVRQKVVNYFATFDPSIIGFNVEVLKSDFLTTGPKCKEFENKVAEYIDEYPNNHVIYRVTPVFEGNNLVASGVQMEAYSVEDNGKGVCFNVYVYNVQPGIIINYETGESWLEE